MNKKIIVSIVGVVVPFILIGASFVFVKFRENKVKTNEVVFTATLKDTPQQDRETVQYFINFNNIKFANNKDKDDLVLLKEGGVLLTTLPADRSIKKGDKIFVTLKRNFSATKSSPPQISESDIIRVDFK